MNTLTKATIRIHHRYGIGDSPVYICRTDDSALGAELAASYAWWKCQEIFTESSSLTCRGVAEVLVAFFGYQYAEPVSNKYDCEEIDLYSVDIAGRATFELDRAIGRVDMIKVMKPHLAWSTTDRELVGAALAAAH